MLEKVLTCLGTVTVSVHGLLLSLCWVFVCGGDFLSGGTLGTILCQGQNPKVELSLNSAH